MKSQRLYSSPLRQHQQEETRQRIIAAAIDSIAENPLADLSHEQLARRAGIALRTVYRHFPVRTELLDAVWQESDRRLGLIEYPDTEQAIMEAAQTVFRKMDENAALINGLLSSDAGLEMRRRANERRRVAVTSALANATKHLDEHRRSLVIGIFQALYSARTWQMLRDRAHLKEGESTEAIVWAMSTLLDSLYREQKRAARQASPKQALPRKTRAPGPRRSTQKSKENPK